MKTRGMKTRGRTPKWVDRQIDEALLAIAMQAGFLYAHRRARRMFPKVARGAVLASGVGAATAAAAAVVATGVGILGVAGGAAAWYRHSKRSAAVTLQAAEAGWRPTGVGAPPETKLGSNAAGAPVQAAEAGRSTTE